MNALTVPSHFAPLNFAACSSTETLSPLSHFQGASLFVCHGAAAVTVTVPPEQLTWTSDSSPARDGEAMVNATRAAAAATTEPRAFDTRIIRLSFPAPRPDTPAR